MDGLENGIKLVLKGAIEIYAGGVVNDWQDYLRNMERMKCSLLDKRKRNSPIIMK